MSIIADALKKAQRFSQKKDQEPAKSASGEAENKEPEKKKRSPAFYVFTGSTAVVLSILSIVLMFRFFGQDLLANIKGRSGPVDNPATSVVKIEKPLHIVETPAIGAVKEKKLVPKKVPTSRSISTYELNKAVKLNGIMYTPERPLAVINNNIWGEGDEIGKFKIVEIRKDFVKVAANGQEFVIRLKR
ncbi:MAG: hypothetical protein ISS92_01465 [Candidatus Omnitrophica bacterium]|nr:hypothetical protein [Candidatus Omnitrophota bacterium]